MSHDDTTQAIVAQISDALGDTDLRVACAESLTAGQIATALGAGEKASEWFAGGVVAYTAETKFIALGVDPGPVVTAEAAEQMARGVARLLEVPIAVAVTGVGGPDEQDGQPVGTVFAALIVHGEASVHHHHFDGSPLEIVEATTVTALRLLRDGVRR